MYAEVLTTPSRATDSNGNGYSGAKWYFYAPGTTTPQAVYTTPALTTAHPNPVVANSGGLFPAIYFDPAKQYRGVCKNASGSSTLHDYDPINHSLWHELSAPAGGGRIGFTQGVSGAVARTVQDKLRDAPIDVADFGPLGTADDAATFHAAFAAAKAAGRRLRLPPGTFAVSGLVFEGTIDVSGAGPANTVFVPTGNGQTVVTLKDRGTPYLDRGMKARFADFSVDISGRTGCTGLRTDLMVRGVLERIRVIGDETAPFTGGSIGWLSYGDQFCSFRSIYVEHCQRGFVMTNDATGGGGNNNHFDGLHVAYCQVNAMIVGAAVWPMGVSHFTNVCLQDSGHCGLYLNNVQGLYMSMLSPENDTAGTATLSIGGYSVKRGTIHAVNRVSARFDGYQHANALPEMRITAEDHSSLRFDVAQGAAVQVLADETSSVMWEGQWGEGSTFRNARVSAQDMGSARSLVAWHPADVENRSAQPNEVPFPVTVPLAATFNCTSALCSDPDVGVVRQVSYLAQAGGQTSNAVACRLSATDFANGDMMWASILLKSDRDTQIGFAFAEMSASGTIDLKANQWTRLLVANHNETGLTRLPILGLWPVATDQPVLRIAKPIGARNLSGQQARLLSERHAFNPRDPLGAVLRLTAPPAAGSWAAGDVVVNASPTAGGTPGWTCVAAGTPGTWKAQAALSA